MAVLSKRIVSTVARTHYEQYGLRVRLIDISGKVLGARDELGAMAHVRRRRGYALQAGIDIGAPYTFTVAPGIAAWVLGIEDRRMIHGGLLSAEVRLAERRESTADAREHLTSHGLPAADADRFLSRLPVWPESRLTDSALRLQETFYSVSGWKPELMNENRLKALQQEQISRAIEDQRKHGKPALYAFEQERILLASIRAGDRNGARRILNEMLATIYLSSPSLVVLRARTIALMSCLTRAAIEDNPLMEPLIERNHAWTEKLVHAQSFEELSQVLMEALDDFMEGIYLHGVNRSNTRVRKALDYISENFARRISLQSVARSVGVSPCRLSHLVKDFTGKTVLQILQQVRIRHAQHLLERTSKTCTEIAYEAGFGDQSYFIKHFKRLTGTTPARYRRFGSG